MYEVRYKYSNLVKYCIEYETEDGVALAGITDDIYITLADDEEEVINPTRKKSHPMDWPGGRPTKPGIY